MEKNRIRFLVWLLIEVFVIPAVFYVVLGFGAEPKTAFAAAAVAAAAVVVAAVVAAAFAAVAAAAFAAVVAAAFAFVAVVAVAAVVVAVAAAAAVVVAVVAADEMKCKWWRVMALLVVEVATIFCAEYLYTLPEIGWWLGWLCHWHSLRVWLVVDVVAATGKS